MLFFFFSFFFFFFPFFFYFVQKAASLASIIALYKDNTIFCLFFKLSLPNPRHP